MSSLIWPSDAIWRHGVTELNFHCYTSNEGITTRPLVTNFSETQWNNNNNDDDNDNDKNDNDQKFSQGN